MSSQCRATNPLAAVVRIAAQAEPPPLEPAQARWMIASALAEGGQPVPRRTIVRTGMLIGVAVAATLVLAIGIAEFTRGAPGRGTPWLRVGDGWALVAADTELRLARSADGDELELMRGRVLILLPRPAEQTHAEQPVAGARPVEVIAPAMHVRADHAVFALQVEGEQTRLRVDAGAISLGWAAGSQQVVAGEQVESSVLTHAPATRLETRAVDRAGQHQSEQKSGVAAARRKPQPVAAVDQERRSTTSASRDRPASLADVRRLLAGGHYEAVLRLAAGRRGGRWRMVEADALRGLGRGDEAANRYLVAARQLDPQWAAAAGLLAAQVWFRRGAHRQALAALDETRAEQPGRGVAERALALRMRILVAAGDRAAARAVAERYLRRFPRGSLRDWAASL